jgi:archaeosine synthase
MSFIIKKRDCNARIGELTIDKNKINTPNILYVDTDRFKAPEFSDILLTKIGTKKLSLKSDDIGNDIKVVEYASQLFQKPKNFVDYIVDLKEQIVYAPTIGIPSNIALLAYIGIDLFDSTSAIIAARNKTMFFSDGEYKIKDLIELPCNCPVCNKAEKNPTELDFKEILSHNYYILNNELKQIRNSIKKRNLRNHVEKRVQSNPHFATILRNLDNYHYEYLEEHTPVASNVIIFATSKESFDRPEIKRFQERVLNRYKKPDSTKILLLLPCSAKKPYSFSKTHKFFRRKIQETSNPDVVHEIIITSPIGIVPRELEVVYPVSNYDIPVTGFWDENEKKMIRTLLKKYLEKNNYKHIFIHLPENITNFVKDIFEKPTITCVNNPISDKSLNSLFEKLNNKTSYFKKVDKKIRKIENIESLCCYQFGKQNGIQLMKNTYIKGKYPFYKIFEDGKQLGTLVEDRGLISLTIDGAKKIFSNNNYLVQIDDDFKIKGSVLAPGVKKAYHDIRIGDEVLIVKNNKLTGVGVATMSGRLMEKSNYGEAVKVRHII